MGQPVDRRGQTEQGREGKGGAATVRGETKKRGDEMGTRYIEKMRGETKKRK